MRGNPGRQALQRLGERSIPAYAGEPKYVVLSVAITQVYPRVCGGTRGSAAAFAHFRGLSPRMRGNPTRVHFRYLTLGSIPAYAGEPEVTSARANANQVYPRVCGGTRQQHCDTRRD